VKLGHLSQEARDALGVLLAPSGHILIIKGDTSLISWENPPHVDDHPCGVCERATIFSTYDDKTAICYDHTCKEEGGAGFHHVIPPAGTACITCAAAREPASEEDEEEEEEEEEETTADDLKSITVAIKRTCGWLKHPMAIACGERALLMYKTSPAAAGGWCREHTCENCLKRPARMGRTTCERCGSTVAGVVTRKRAAEQEAAGTPEKKRARGNAA
jgi:hypothetical protein